MDEGFIIMCRNCYKGINLKNGINTYKEDVQLQGELYAEYEAKITVTCTCGNEIDILNKL